MTIQFKNHQNQWFTKALFREFNAEGPLSIPELKEKFLSCTDPYEYEFATAHLGGWDHWQVLQKAPFLAPHIAAWREELDIKLRSKALAGIFSIAVSDGKDAYQARKWIVEGGYAPKATKGRPSKAEVARKAKEIALEDRQVAEDFDRLFN